MWEVTGGTEKVCLPCVCVFGVYTFYMCMFTFSSIYLCVHVYMNSYVFVCPLCEFGTICVFVYG